MTSAPLAGPSSPIGALLLRPPLRVGVATTLREVASAMADAGTSVALVGEGTSAIVTERDLAQALARGLGPSDPVSEAATGHPVAAPATEHLAAATARMLAHGVRHLVVLDDAGDAVGVLSLREAVRILLRSVDPETWMSALEDAADGTG
jgi:CBS domain-containing protein